MSSRRKIEDRIKKKEQEIQELELKIREAKAYIQAMNDVVKLIPDDGGRGANRGPRELREGSMMASARDAIMKAGQPLHILKLLEAVGKPFTRENRASLAGSISAYVRRGEIFTRRGPNTFGLVEFETADMKPPPASPLRKPPSPSLSREAASPSSPPPDFGIDDDDEEEIKF